jgi:hypothetical protein
LTWSVTTKKFAMDFSQNKKDLNVELKKTVLLEQHLWEMESILAAGIIPKPLSFENPPSSTKVKSVNISAGSKWGGRTQGTVGDGRPHSIVDGDGQVQGSVDAQSIVRDGRLPEKTLRTHQGANLAQKFDSQLNIPTIPNDISAKMSRVTKDDWVGGNKISLASPLLQVNIGGVGRTPLWRILCQRPTNFTFEIHIQTATTTLAGPLVWLPI